MKRGVKCKGCGMILVSEYRHDFVSCRCPAETFADGGDDYLRYGTMTGVPELVLVKRVGTTKNGRGIWEEGADDAKP